MGAAELLRKLDDRLLPPLARGAQRLAGGRLRPRLLTGAALAGAVGVLLTVAWAADRAPAGDPSVGDVVRVGVRQGDSVPDYIAAGRGELAGLLAAEPGSAAPGQPYALVSFAGYLAPDRLTPVVGGVSLVQVHARVPLPRVQTQLVRITAFRVPDDVTAGMLATAARKDREAADYRRLAAELTGAGAEVDRLRAVYDSGAAVAEAEATAYRTRCSCVYAAVVRASPAALEQIAGRPEVRAVDPAPEVRRLDRTVFVAPLPEQRDVVRPPADDGSGAVPAGASGSPVPASTN